MANSMTLDAAARCLARSCNQETEWVVVFDGACNFCSGWAQFVIKRDLKRNFQFASAQSEKGTAILSTVKFRVQNRETIVLIDGSRYYEKSDAVLEILKRLGGVWFASQIFVLVPKRLRDACYTAFARRRYRWFGKSDTCSLSDVKGRDYLSQDDRGDSLPRATMQLSAGELARLEQMVASCQIRSDPLMLSATDLRMDAMLHAPSMTKKGGMESHYLAKDLPAAEEIASYAIPVEPASDPPTADPESKKVSGHAQGMCDQPRWKPAPSLDQLIQIRRALMRNEEPKV